MTEELSDSEEKLSNGEESRESDNAWQFKSVPEEETEKWKMEKERYEEVIEYIREVDEILDLIKPFPREGSLDKRVEPPPRSDVQSPRFGLDHLENIIKLVEQLKELQENNHKTIERSCYLKDLKKLREHKKRLKDEELEIRSRTRIRSITAPEEYELCPPNRKSSSTSEKLEREPKERWQDKRKSICLGENRSKVSKWTKVKEAFHWEKASGGPKPLKRENSLGEGLQREEGGHSRDASPEDFSAVFSPPTPPLPPPPPPPPRSRPGDLPSLRCLQDLPSSSSDRMDEFLSFSEMKENKMSDLDSPGHPFDDVEDIEIGGRRSFCEEPPQSPQPLTKEEFSPTRSTKSNKTTWGKVKDIIQTRKDSLKKKPKKRAGDEFKKRRKLSTVSNPQFSDQFEDLSSPEDKVKNITTEIIPKPAYDFQDENQPPVEVKCMKRLTPALTVTLPSTEELRSFSFDDIDKRESLEEDKSNILSQFSCQAQYCEDKSKFGKSKSGSNQRLSRWIKVKRVFLTSTTPARPPQYLPVCNSSPTSQNKSSGFFSDLESDDLSSGEWIEDKSPSQERQKLCYPEPQSPTMTIIHEDIRKSYNELQKKLSQEFEQKLSEWGEAKSEALTKQEDACPKLKVEDGDCIPKFRKTRDSITVPLPNLNDLSPEFKKKLNDWKKMKTSQSSSSVSSSAKDEIQAQNIKIRIGEWQPWKNRCSTKGGSKGEQGEQFEEGQKGWGTSRPPANRRKDEDGGIVGGTSRRDSKRRDSVKKLSHSRTSSGGDSLISTSSTEKDGRFIRKSQKVKDFHWVEKELQKIEREKLRLEQEREKYLEREARLEKMKKTMGTSPTKEILVRTPEGFIRFKGISQKFTKKLYEWEKARGIAPEASTFALLEESTETGAGGELDADGVMMQRSKSTGSVPELSSTLLIQTMANHPSSLSLNDVDELKREDESLSLKEEPEAIIVDVEDVEEETAVLAEGRPIQSETPIYTFTSETKDRITETKRRFYLSGGFDVKITAEREIFGSGVKVFDNLPGTGDCYSGANLCLEDAESRTMRVASENFYKRQEKVVMASTEKNFQGAEEEKKTSEDPFRSAIPNCGYLKTKTEDICDMKTEKTEDAGFPSVSPKSSQRSFSQWLDKEETERHLTTVTQVPFERKDPEKSDTEVLKRRIKEKITLMQRMSTEASWKYSDVDFRKQNERTRHEKEEKVGRFEKMSKMEEQTKDVSEETGSVNVFVPTTRKIISPVKTTDGATPSVCSYVIDDVKPETQEKPEQTLAPKKPPEESKNSPIFQKKTETDATPVRDIGMPPLPNSPKTFKKLTAKETAPSIRMIIAKYNQKITEHDNTEGKRTESGSPIWRSPVFGRRTQERIEMFSAKEDENGRRNGEVQKSASLDNMRTRASHRSSLTPPQDAQIKGILKSSSVGVMRTRSQNQDPPDVTPETSKETSPSVLRALKIQKAKEDFLSGRLAISSEASTSSANENPSTSEDRITTQEAEQEQNLKKSVSAETITLNHEGKSSRGEVHSEKMADSRPLQKSSSKFDISSIKSKFRKIRMRKEKDPKPNAVAVLCRQSLFIEVPKASENSVLSKSCPSSPVMDRNKSGQPPKK